MEVISFAVKNSSVMRAPRTLFRPRPRSFDIGEFFEDLSTEIKVQKKNVRHYVAFLIAVPFCIAVSFGIVTLLRKHEGRPRMVNFDNSDIAEEAYIDKAMFELAVNTEVFFDNEGNLVTSDGKSASVEAVDFVFREPVSFQEYVVKSGDTISSISQKFGLSNISTLIAINQIDNVRFLPAGKRLQVPSIDGLIHSVADGETLEGLSVKYRVTVEDLLDVNDMDSAVLNVGDKLFIPGAKLDNKSLQKAMGEVFAWPITASWRLSSAFGNRSDPFTGVLSYHTGIDMACPQGTEIKAAMSGTVAVSGWSNVFGNYVIIKHIDGYQTLYGHMSKIYAKKGKFVSQGTVIGLVGSTGYSTGPHLHFTVYKNGKLVNPMSVLK